MQKLAKILREACVPSVVLRESAVWKELNEMHPAVSRPTRLAVGRWQILADSSRGCVSVVQLWHVACAGLWFEVRLNKSGTYQFLHREEVCKFVCHHLARTPDLIIDAWRAEHGA